MKKLFAYLGLLSFCALSVLLPVSLIEGCKSPPETVAYKAIGTQVVTVETAKKAVADAYVAGQISEKDFQSIHTVSNQYDAAVKVEQSVVLAYKAGDPSGTNNLNAAMLAVSESSATLIAFALKLLPPDRAAKLRGL